MDKMRGKGHEDFDKKDGFITLWAYIDVSFDTRAKTNIGIFYFLTLIVSANQDPKPFKLWKSK